MLPVNKCDCLNNNIILLLSNVDVAVLYLLCRDDIHNSSTGPISKTDEQALLSRILHQTAQYVTRLDTKIYHLGKILFELLELTKVFENKVKFPTSEQWICCTFCCMIELAWLSVVCEKIKFGLKWFHPKLILNLLYILIFFLGSWIVRARKIDPGWNHFNLWSFFDLQQILKLLSSECSLFFFCHSKS